jgi:hypothetical protein
MKHINLKIPEHSYFFGFVQADGSLTASSRNRGKLQIELAKVDLHLLRSFKKLFSTVYSSINRRIRDTNFKNYHESYTLAIFNIRFRNELHKLGIPYGKKSEIIPPPKSDFCERDYIRGLIDGDGSVGLAKSKGNIPFLSLVVASEELKEYIVNVIESITGEKKKINRNRRDDVYNIMLNREKAQQFIEYLYYPDCLSLERKFKKAKTALKWRRPKDLKRISRNEWHRWEDEYILNHTVKESCNHLKRTEKSVKMRLWRLRNKKIKIKR